MSYIVSKFGGTSMGDVPAMKRSAQVSLKQKSYLVVVSASSGTTNKLIEVSIAALKGDQPKTQELIQEIKHKHQSMAKEISLPEDQQNALASLYNELESLAQGISLLKDCSERTLDALMSIGERMSSVLFRRVLEIEGAKKQVSLVDARDVIITDEFFGKARPQIDKIKIHAEELKKKYPEKDYILVSQGFIGKTEEGSTTTLGRGGSDYSAALFAEALMSSQLEIWTDVAGIATTDPRITKDAKMINAISFQEASELATFGAKVLHPATLLPAIRQNIPVLVASSFEPAKPGTWIKKEVQHYPLVRAMAIRKKQVLVTLSTPAMLHSHGFLFEVFKIFNNHKVSIDAITTSEISVAMTLDDSTLLNKKLISELSQIADVQVEENLSLVSLIGNNINHTPGLAKKVFDSIPDINVRMICLGASRHNFCFLVNENSAEDAIRLLHATFVK